MLLLPPNRGTEATAGAYRENHTSNANGKGRGMDRFYVHPIYTAGYANKRAEELFDAAITLDAIVLDIRYSPWSARPEWRRDSLANLLGKRYAWLFAFGNRNYKGGPIELVDVTEGTEKVGTHARHQPVILLCGCKDPKTCHRSVVADILRRREGMTVSELEW